MSKQKVEVSQASDAVSLEFIEDKIRERAYQLSEQRGFEDGHAMDDWLQAEAEVLGKKPCSSADANTRAEAVAAG